MAQTLRVRTIITERAGGYGVCWSALCVIASPVAEMSSPAPAVAVAWQAPSKDAALISVRSIRAIETVLRMVSVLRYWAG